MKILHIASGDLWAGAEVQIFTLLSELVKHNDVYAIVLNPGRLAQALETIGVNVSIIPEETYSFIALFAQIRSKIGIIKPDIIHTHRQKENILGSFAGVLNGHAQQFRTVHGSPEFTLNWKQKLQRSVDIFAARFLQFGIISVSETLTTELAQLIPQSKIRTILNGIDGSLIEQDALKPVEKLAEDCIHIGLAGRMVKVKRVDLFLAMAKLLLEKHKDKKYHFHVFGDGPLLADYRALADKLQIQNYVTFYGHCDDVRARINQMRIMVMTSDHEGLPMTALEALALKKPLVSHAVGGLKPLLTEAWSIGLVTDHSPVGYTNAILKTVDKLSSGDVPELPVRFSAEQNAARVVAFYQQALQFKAV